MRGLVAVAVLMVMCVTARAQGPAAEAADSAAAREPVELVEPAAEVQAPIEPYSWPGFWGGAFNLGRIGDFVGQWQEHGAKAGMKALGESTLKVATYGGLAYALKRQVYDRIQDDDNSGAAGDVGRDNTQTADNNNTGQQPTVTIVGDGNVVNLDMMQGAPAEE